MRTRLSILIGASLALVGLAVPASAGPAAVNAQEFYVDAQALLKKGAMAMFDKRTKPRMAQLKAAGEAARSDNEAATRRGTPLYCVSDAERKKGLDPQKAMDLLGAVPEAQRRRSTLRQAWLAALVRKYPCG